MSKIHIIYATKTKHSKKLAEAIGKALNCKPENISSKPVITETDLLFIVGGIYGGNNLPELLEFIQTLENSEVKKTALITTCTSMKQGQSSVRNLLAEKGIPVVDEILSQGSFLFMKMGHPNKSDITEAVEFAVKVAEQAVE